ncbi:MAG: UDP-N-acetylglucosamine 1-carboxyvinyltransferase, partial [Clostridia bacterium]|nr:UDP-N-acetylglucosamine 1-carboxyvinyltransferase [Clostridia bacterium]
ADISVVGGRAIISGVRLHGTNVEATELRGGAGLVVAALNAHGTSSIGGLEYIDRGYEKIENIFSKLGARILRKEV